MILQTSEQHAQPEKVQSTGSLEEILARRLEQDRIETSKQFGVPLWILTKPVEPHMQESPSELD